MVSFDKFLWWRRAWDRHRKAIQRGDEASLATAKWAREAIAVSQLEALVAWCEKKGLGVEFGKKVAAIYDQNTKTMVISGRLSPEKQVHLLLHECGHFLVGDDPRFKAGYPMALEPQGNRDFEHRLACLEEEIEAWNRGWKLAVRLRLSVDPEAFERSRSECLRSYVKWAGKILRK